MKSETGKQHYHQHQNQWHLATEFFRVNLGKQKQMIHRDRTNKSSTKRYDAGVISRPTAWAIWTIWLAVGCGRVYLIQNFEGTHHRKIFRSCLRRLTWMILASLTNTCIPEKFFSVRQFDTHSCPIKQRVTNTTSRVSLLKQRSSINNFKLSRCIID